MKITRQSMITGEVHTLDLRITKEQIANYLKGAGIKDAFANLTPEEQAFIVTGVIPEELAPEELCFGKFQRIDSGDYVGSLDLAALKNFGYKLDRMPCKIMPEEELAEDDYFDSWDCIKLIYYKAGD